MTKGEAMARGGRRKAILAEPPPEFWVIPLAGGGSRRTATEKCYSISSAHRSRSMRTTVLLAACIASAAAFAPAALPKVASRKAGISGE